MGSIQLDRSHWIWCTNAAASVSPEYIYIYILTVTWATTYLFCPIEYVHTSMVNV